MAAPKPGTAQPVGDLSKQAEMFLRELRKNIMAMFHPHAPAHSPGGKDPVLLPLSAITDITYQGSALVPGQTLTVNADFQWTNGAGGGTLHGAYLYVPMPGTTTPPTLPPGPKNVSGDAHTITAVTAKSDGACAGSMTGGTFSFSAGGGEDDTASLSTAWADGARLSVTIDSCGADATYLVIDWAFA